MIWASSANEQHDKDIIKAKAYSEERMKYWATQIKE
jgi:hypothetical protein